MDITLQLTEVQYKALSMVCKDPQEYLQNFANARCQSAIDEIAKKEVERMLADPNTTSIPADKETIVINAKNSA